MTSPLHYLLITVSPAKRYLTGLFRCCMAFLLHGLTMILPGLQLYKRKLPLLLGK